MGQTLSEPVTSKKSTSGEDEFLIFGVSEMQGWRLGMEDAHAHVLSLHPTSETEPKIAGDTNSAEPNPPATGDPPDNDKTGTETNDGGGAGGGDNQAMEGVESTAKDKDKDVEKEGEKGQDAAQATVNSTEKEGEEGSKDGTIKMKKEDRAAGFFAVYDGHGGANVAQFAGKTLHNRLAALESYREGKWQESLKRSFLATDEALSADAQYKSDPSGCTAVAVLMTGDGKIVAANAGDSRGVLSSGGEVIALSYDHKPVNKTENSRIVAAGGFVEFGRVNGNLALSRAIGDFEFKKNKTLPPEEQVVTANPDILVHQTTEDDEFIVLACDGIWDVLTSQQVVDYVRRSIAEKKPLETICEALMDKCLAPDSDWGGVGCDNMTVLIIGILNGRTKEEWYDWIAERVERSIGKRETPQCINDPFPNSRKNFGYGGLGARNNSPLTGTLGGGNLVQAALGRSAFGGIGGENPGGGDEGEDEGGLSIPEIAAVLRNQGISLSFGDDEEDDDDEMDEDEDGNSATPRAHGTIEEIQDDYPQIVQSPSGVSDASFPSPTMRSKSPESPSKLDLPPSRTTQGDE